MRRFVAILMLVLLPLQVSWAAAAVYCQHETAAEAAHFGHHEHRHDGHAADGAADAKLPGAVDGDCSVCHAICAVAVFAASAPAVVAADTAVAVPFPDPPASAPTARPERPNWRVLA